MSKNTASADGGAMPAGDHPDAALFALAQLFQVAAIERGQSIDDVGMAGLSRATARFQNASQDERWRASQGASRRPGQPAAQGWGARLMRETTRLAIEALAREQAAKAALDEAVPAAKLDEAEAVAEQPRRRRRRYRRPEGTATAAEEAFAAARVVEANNVEAIARIRRSIAERRQ